MKPSGTFVIPHRLHNMSTAPDQEQGMTLNPGMDESISACYRDVSTFAALSLHEMEFEFGAYLAMLWEVPGSIEVRNLPSSEIREGTNIDRLS